MQNIFELGLVPYMAADPLEEISLCKKFLFGMSVLCDIVKVLVLSIPHWLISLYRCIISPTKKCVKGQTVLVFCFKQLK